jgi:hypothetical protein
LLKTLNPGVNWLKGGRSGGFASSVKLLLPLGYENLLGDKYREFGIDLGRWNNFRGGGAGVGGGLVGSGRTLGFREDNWVPGGHLGSGRTLGFREDTWVLPYVKVFYMLSIHKHTASMS